MEGGQLRRCGRPGKGDERGPRRLSSKQRAKIRLPAELIVDAEVIPKDNKPKGHTRDAGRNCLLQ